MYENLLPPAVKGIMQPIFNDLSNTELLKGCVNLQTQNQNESFHHLLWSIIPKDQYQSPQVMKLGVNLAVLLFNTGYNHTITKLYTALGLSISSNARMSLCKIDKDRIVSSRHHASKACKEARKAKRQQKRRKIDAFKEAEGIQYQSGLLHKPASVGAKKVRCCTKCRLPLHELKGTGHTKQNCKG